MKTPKRGVMVRNILRVYRSASAAAHRIGASWYANESDVLAVLAHDLELPLAAVCGAAAAISPGMRWEYVPGYVHALATASDPESITVPTYCREFVRRAVRCLRGERPEDVLGGPKVRAFYGLLLTRGQGSEVVIDGHAFNIARAHRAPIRCKGAGEPVSIGPSRFAAVAAAYCRAAEIAGVPPHVVQAVTWVEWRKRHGIA